MLVAASRSTAEHCYVQIVSTSPMAGTEHASPASNHASRRSVQINRPSVASVPADPPAHGIAPHAQNAKDRRRRRHVVGPKRDGEWPRERLRIGDHAYDDV